MQGDLELGVGPYVRHCTPLVEIALTTTEGATPMPPRRMAAARPARLTFAERYVFVHALAGESNASIAKARNVALRTVANQLASLFTKLQIESRYELFAAVRRRAVSQERCGDVLKLAFEHADDRYDLFIQLRARVTVAPVTEREVAVLDRVSRGLLTKEIAYELDLCAATIATTLARIRERAQLHPRSLLAIAWVAAGLSST